MTYMIHRSAEMTMRNVDGTLQVAAISEALNRTRVFALQRSGLFPSHQEFQALPSRGRAGWRKPPPRGGSVQPGAPVRQMRQTLYENSTARAWNPRHPPSRQ